MTNLAILIVCMIVGVALRTLRRAPENAHAGLNAYVVHVALPALILDRIHGLTLTADMVWPISMPWLLFGLAAASFAGLARIAGWSRNDTGALIMTAGLANTSFVGIPMIEAFYGPRDVSTGILIDQLGTYLVLSTAGIAVAALFSAGTASGRSIVLRIATFPPLIALALAFALMRAPYPDWLTGVLHRLGDTLAPIALVSVGLQLRLDQLRGKRALLGMGLGFKLVLAPLLLALLYVGALSRHGETARVTLFESAMGPMIGGAIVAAQAGLNPPLIALMVGIGIALSFLTLPLWYLGLVAV